MIRTSLIVLFAIIFATNAWCQEKYTLKSPNGSIAANFWLTPAGEPLYSVSYAGNIVLKPSKLGVVRDDADFSIKLALDSVSGVSSISDKYTLLHGKRLNNNYVGNKRIVYLKNGNSKTIEIIFQVSNDGVAFRYYFPEKTVKPSKILKEVTSFHFDAAAKAFLQPCPDGRTGWNFSQPSYEEYYSMNIPVGTSSPNQAGWVMPALFNFETYWMSITETAVDTNYCGSRLSQFSPDGEYCIQFPQPQETKPDEGFLPESTGPWHTPWRVIALTNNLGSLVESTLETDLALPAKYDVSSWLQPGISSWSWVLLKDDSTTFDVQRKFIDFASSMHWKYCLIDAFWDKQIGFDKIKELADYSKTKNVKLLLWYNSAGDWNTTPLTPRNKLLTKNLRNSEFKKLKDLGIAGIKVDFFGGDGQWMINYYADILKDAAQYNLAVNFHGCTFPRGWYRTYPNLVSMEAIRGEEYITFSQFSADQQPSHCAVIPFTRNLFDPMDFTPVNFSGIPNIKRKTTLGFETALSVIFTSGIQHIAETPSGMSAQKDFVQEYMRSLPDRWEDVKYIDGFPGKFIVLARKAGDQWYIAGINGDSTAHEVTLNMPFITGKVKGSIITDSADAKDVVINPVNLAKPITLTMQAHGGFVIKTMAAGKK